MKILKIVDYDKRELGTLSVDQVGELNLEISDQDYEDELDELLTQLRKGPLPIRTYERILSEDRIRIETYVRILEPSDPDYLWAVKDFLFFNSIHDLRLLGQVIEKSTLTTLPTGE